MLEGVRMIQECEYSPAGDKLSRGGRHCAVYKREIQVGWLEDPCNVCTMLIITLMGHMTSWWH